VVPALVDPHALSIVSNGGGYMHVTRGGGYIPDRSTCSATTHSTDKCSGSIGTILYKKSPNVMFVGEFAHVSETILYPPSPHMYMYIGI
jgi:hypothetical protein